MLEALGVSGEWIWGNDVETVVFAGLRAWEDIDFSIYAGQ